MELKELYTKQKQLDDYVISNKGLEGMNPEDRLTNTILAMMVETGELANEVRTFKHWSDKPMSHPSIVIEEYVDVLHFFLSIGNQLEFTPEQIEDAYKKKWQKNHVRQDNWY